MTRGAAIRVDGASKAFDLPHERRETLKEHFLHPLQRTYTTRLNAVDDVTFDVAKGEFFGIVGPNGSGKSTLLKLLAGIYRPTSGSVWLDGRVSPFVEIGVGFNPDLNARTNIRINGTLLGLPPRELRARTDEILAFAELEDFRDQRLKNFSTGMQMRLAYAIAIQVPFDILLLDEVLAVGDESFQQKCFMTFERFRAEGKTVVLVSHDLTSVEQFCDRVLFMDGGSAAAIGDSAEVIGAYLSGVASAS
jgi:ABC-type polysaccharide/polyol phosphate transport system ATPase subunit